LSKTGHVLACSGDKNVYEFYRGLAEAPITAVVAFSASGMMSPPMLRHENTRIPSEITRRFSDDWRVRCSPTGWMTTEVFYKNILENIIPSSVLSFSLMDSIPM
jgi:hypothetical protein